MERKYFIYGKRPVFEEKVDDIRNYYAFQWETGEFKKDYSYLLKINHDESGDAEEVTKEDFDKYVEELKKEKGLN